MNILSELFGDEISDLKQLVKVSSINITYLTNIIVRGRNQKI